MQPLRTRNANKRVWRLCTRPMQQNGLRLLRVQDCYQFTGLLHLVRSCCDRVRYLVFTPVLIRRCSHSIQGFAVGAPPPVPQGGMGMPQQGMLPFGAPTSVMVGLAPPPPPPPPPGQVRPFQVVINWDRLRFVELIGQGTFGYVHKAFYDRTPVAVKKLQAQMNDTELITLFNRELSVIKYAARITFCSRFLFRLLLAFSSLLR